MIPSHAGLLITVQPAVMTVSAPISGIVSDRVGTRWLSMAGMAIWVWSVFALAPGAVSSGVRRRGMEVCGLGTGMFITPNNSALMGAAPAIAKASPPECWERHAMWE